MKIHERKLQKPQVSSVEFWNQKKTYSSSSPFIHSLIIMYLYLETINVFLISKKNVMEFHIRKRVIIL